MDYKEKYEQGLECIQEILSSGQEKIKMTLLKERLQPFFPELGESEDELTWLTKFIEEEAYSLSMDIRDNEDRIKLKNLQKSLAWLEKQGEEFDDNIITRDDEILQAISIGLTDAAEDLGWSDFGGLPIEEIQNWLEKQGKQKAILNVPSREVILSIWDLGNEWKELTNGSISTEYGTQLDYIQKHWHESEYYLREKQNEKKQFYIRFGDIPEGEKSSVWRGDEFLGKENGVSVYPAFKHNGNIVLGLSLPITKTTLYTLQHLLEYDNRPCYLVIGDYIGNGADGEPLIRNVEIVEEIKDFRVKEGEARYKIKDSDSLSVNGQPFDYEKATITQKDFEEIVNAVKDTSILEMVMPKFKVGDFILNGDVTNDGKPEIFKIQKICSNWYDVENIYDSRKTIITFNQEWSCKLWTIQDAEDGDVLVASDSSLFIFAKVKDNSAYYYFSLCKNGSKEISDGNRAWETANSCHPATKEQRDLLFQEIRKAGYEWDAEKKELNKITFKVGDWLQYRNAKPFFVEEITKQGYVNGNSCLPFNWENEIHLWTIDDAKDGDVLACNEEILLFKSYSVQGRISVYCWYNGQTNNFHSIEVTDASLTTRNKIWPATKEQRDTLFKKIKEAGYQWDAKKKELKLLISNGGDF